MKNKLQWRKAHQWLPWWLAGMEGLPRAMEETWGYWLCSLFLSWWQFHVWIYVTIYQTVHFKYKQFFVYIDCALMKLFRQNYNLKKKPWHVKIWVIWLVQFFERKGVGWYNAKLGRTGRGSHSYSRRHNKKERSFVFGLNREDIAGTQAWSEN